MNQSSATFLILIPPPPNAALTTSQNATLLPDIKMRLHSADTETLHPPPPGEGTEISE
jgi:hypothetical protein